MKIELVAIVESDHDPFCATPDARDRSAGEQCWQIGVLPSDGYEARFLAGLMISRAAFDSQRPPTAWRFPRIRCDCR